MPYSQKKGEMTYSGPAVAFLLHWHQPIDPSGQRKDLLNKNILQECIYPNSNVGNLGRVMHNISPALLMELMGHNDQIYQNVLAAFRIANLIGTNNYGISPLVGQTSFTHAIVPFLPDERKKLHIEWSKAVYKNAFGGEPHGYFSPECATDGRTLEAIAEAGGKWTLLPPTAPAENTIPGKPYKIQLANGAILATVVYEGSLSSKMSFDSDPKNVDSMMLAYLTTLLAWQSSYPRVGAFDGETFGHHRPAGVDALAKILNLLPQNGGTIVNLNRYLHDSTEGFSAVGMDQLPLLKIKPTSSWSCLCQNDTNRASTSPIDIERWLKMSPELFERYGKYVEQLPQELYGLRRWTTFCGCSGFDGYRNIYTMPLRIGLTNAQNEVFNLYSSMTNGILKDPLKAAIDFMSMVKLPSIKGETPKTGEFCEKHFQVAIDPRTAENVFRLLEAVYHSELSSTSCGTFFESVERLEPDYVVGHMAKALSILENSGPMLSTKAQGMETSLLDCLKDAEGPTTNAAEMYKAAKAKLGSKAAEESRYSLTQEGIFIMPTKTKPAASGLHLS